MADVPVWALMLLLAVIGAFGFEAGRLWQWGYDGWRVRKMTKDLEAARDETCRYLSQLRNDPGEKVPF